MNALIVSPTISRTTCRSRRSAGSWPHGAWTWSSRPALASRRRFGRTGSSTVWSHWVRAATRVTGAGAAGASGARRLPRGDATGGRGHPSLPGGAAPAGSPLAAGSGHRAARSHPRRGRARRDPGGPDRLRLDARPLRPRAPVRLTASGPSEHASGARRDLRRATVVSARRRAGARRARVARQLCAEVAARFAHEYAGALARLNSSVPPPANPFAAASPWLTLVNYPAALAQRRRLPASIRFIGSCARTGRAAPGLERDIAALDPNRAAPAEIAGRAAAVLAGQAPVRAAAIGNGLRRRLGRRRLAGPARANGPNASSAPTCRYRGDSMTSRPDGPGEKPGGCGAPSARCSDRRPVHRDPRVQKAPAA